MLAVGIAVGIVVGELLNQGDDMRIFSGMILLFGGLSLILNYYITRKHNS